jgi:hypothetical protein
MKIKLLIFFLFSFALLGQSQGLAVQSFKKLSSDLDARVNFPETDQNGEKCAIIKVVTTQKGFSWEGDALGIVKKEYKVGEYWLYVPHGARRLTIKHEKLGVLRNYVYPYSIKKSNVYELVLKSGNVKTIVEDIEILTQWLVISSKPDSALVYINDVYKGETTFQQELPIGKYTYRVEYPMYHTQAGVIVLDTIKQNKVIDIELKKNYGSLSLISSPENGAKVIVDGKDTGLKTPCVIDYLKSGEHTVSLRHKWYNPNTSKVIIGDEQEEKLTVSMDPNFGDVRILADKESKVYIDGEYKGNGIWNTRLLTGIHVVRIEKKSHNVYEKKINVTIGKNKDIAINLIGKYGKLKVISDPYGAKVSINGMYQGNSPVSLSKLLIGDYTLLIEKDGYSPIAKLINIEENKVLTVNEKLPLGEEITIKTSSKAAKIFLDGSFIGISPVKVVAGLGYHEVQISNKGELHVEEIKVERGKSNSWDIETKADEYIRKGDGYYKKGYFSSSISNYESYLNEFHSGYRNDYVRRQISKINSVLKDREEKEQRRQRRADRRNSRQDIVYMMYSYDEMSPYGLTVGKFNVHRMGWYFTFKCGTPETLDNGVKIAGYNMGATIGTTFKLFYPFWINVGGGVSYVEFYNLDYNIDFSKMIYFPEAGINLRLGKKIVLKFGAQYNFEAGNYLEHFGIGIAL